MTNTKGTTFHILHSSVKLNFSGQQTMVAQILRHLGVRRMRLISNNPRKFHALRGYGLEIVERVPIQITPTKENLRYLRTKKDKLGHLLDLDEGTEE